jgi:hypothetical protein
LIEATYSDRDWVGVANGATGSPEWLLVDVLADADGLAFEEADGESAVVAPVEVEHAARTSPVITSPNQLFCIGRDPFNTPFAPKSPYWGSLHGCSL